MLYDKYGLAQPVVRRALCKTFVIWMHTMNKRQYNEKIMA